MRVRALSWLLALLAAVTLLRAGVPLSAQAAGSDPAPNLNVAALETDFLMGMIPHHRSAIMMAEMATMKATRPELRELAQKEISEQRGEIEKMTHYLRDWYGMDAPEAMMMTPDMMMKMDMPMLHGLMPDDAAQMARLEAATGEEFDIEFMSSMTKHHAMAIMMASTVLMNGHHRDLIELAENITMSQTEEIHQMGLWLKDWYGLA